MSGTENASEQALDCIATTNIAGIRTAANNGQKRQPNQFVRGRFLAMSKHNCK
jgi:hypothetical protein